MSLCQEFDLWGIAFSPLVLSNDPAHLPAGQGELEPRNHLTPRRSGAAPGSATLSPEYLKPLRGRLSWFGCDGVEPIEASPVGRSTPPVAEDGPPPTAAEQVDVRAHVRERIAR